MSCALFRPVRSVVWPVADWGRPSTPRRASSERYRRLFSVRGSRSAVSGPPISSPMTGMRACASGLTAEPSPSPGPSPTPSRKRNSTGSGAWRARRPAAPATGPVTGPSTGPSAPSAHPHRVLDAFNGHRGHFPRPLRPVLQYAVQLGWVRQEFVVALLYGRQGLGDGLHHGLLELAVAQALDRKSTRLNSS